MSRWETPRTISHMIQIVGKESPCSHLETPLSIDDKVLRIESSYLPQFDEDGKWTGFYTHEVKLTQIGDFR